MLAFVDPRIPRLKIAVQSPCFSAAGDLIVAPGYHENSAIYYFETHELVVAEVPRSPTDDDIVWAKRLILEEMLGEFAFQDQASRAHAVGVLILPFVRAMIDGATPLHVIGARHPGSGKGLLSDCISILATGRRADVQTLPKSDDELRKRITAILIEGAPIALLDNLPTTRALNSAALAAAITARSWVDRILGLSKNVRLQNNVVWILTGNSPKFTTELSRRSVRIFLDPKTDRPWERTGFRHADLPRWVTDHRGELVRAVLILVQAWIAKGRPPSDKVLGTFEAWARTIGGILDVAGIAGFLEDRNLIHEDLDAESQEWREFVAAWDERFGASERGVKELLEFCDAHELLASAIRGELPKARETSLGRQLVQRADSVIGDFMIRMASSSARKHGRRYQVVRAASVESGGTSDETRGTSESRGSPITSDTITGTYGDSGNLGNLMSAEVAKNFEGPSKIGSKRTTSQEKTDAFGGSEVPEVPHLNATDSHQEPYDGGTSASGGSPEFEGGSLFRGHDIDEENF